MRTATARHATRAVRAARPPATPTHARPASMVEVPYWQCPRLATAPPQGAPGGSGRLGTPRERLGHWAPRHCLGCSSWAPPKPPISPPLTLQACPADEVKSLLRLDKSCGAGCTAGAYLPNASATCAACDASCRACSGPATTQCTKCTPPMILVRGVCVSSTGANGKANPYPHPSPNPSPTPHPNPTPHQGANGDANITSGAEAQAQLDRVHDAIKKYAGAGKLDIGYKLGGTVQLTNNTDVAPSPPPPAGEEAGGDAGAPDPAVGAVQVLELVLVQGARGNYRCLALARPNPSPTNPSPRPSPNPDPNANTNAHF